jgi:DNA-binding transcriptional regulator YhcF (GntR family)
MLCAPDDNPAAAGEGPAAASEARAAAREEPAAAGEVPAAAIAVDRHAEVPIGVQLAWALRSRIADGRLAAGERLPALRDLAAATGVNVNTVRAVYQRLEQDGLIVSQQGSGTFVADADARHAAVGTIAASAAREALQTGVDPREVAAALYVSAAPDAERTGRTGAARRRLLRGEIATLERTLAELQAAHPGLLPPPAHRPAAGGPATGGPTLPSAAELERVRAELLRRLAKLQALIDEQPAEAIGARGSAARDRRSKPTRTAAAKRAAGRPAATEEAPEQQAPAKRARPRPTSRPAAAGT